MYEPGLAGVGEKREGWRESTHLADRALIGGGGAAVEARPSGTAAPAPKGRALTPAMEDSRRTLSHRASAREGEREREGEEGRARARGRG